MSYEYLNTRLTFMKAKMLSPEFFGQLLGMEELDDLINALADTDYADELEKSSVEFEGYEMIEEALIRHVQRVFSKISDMAFDEAGPLVEILLERFEVFNLKTILRGFHVNSDPEEISESLFPTIVYPTSFYQELLKRDGISAVVDYLLSVGNHYYKPLSEVMPEYEANGKLAQLEWALDSAYFGDLRKKLQSIGDENAEIVRRILGTETDILNMTYALRLIEAQVESEEKYRYIIEGGERFKEEDVRDLLGSGDKSTFIRKIDETYYGRKLGEIEEDISANDLQERLENLIYRENCKTEVDDFFNIRMVSTYVWRKNVESTNIRVIASGLWRGAAKDEVMKRLIWVEGMMPDREAVNV